ncbi:MAG: hypothetical protein IJZ38_13025 [Bacteroides sp.]|nr:hypothetical protein [Bacteroides sp.]
MAKQELPVISYKGRKSPNGYKKGFSEKSPEVQTLIREALHIVEELGIPTNDLTDIRKEKIAMALLAVGDVKSSKEWAKIKDANKSYAVTTKQMIDFYNQHLEDSTSKGSYDYVLRHGLKRLLIAGIVVQSKPDSNLSDSTRGYKVSVEYSKIIRTYHQKDWAQQVAIFNRSHKTYAERLAQKRDIPKITVRTADGQEFQLKDGEHNLIQQQIIQEFLPRFGHGAKILYCGDSDNKYGVINETDSMTKLGISDISQGKLPDVVAYSESKGWIFLIEAYHSSNPITAERKYELEQMMGSAASKCVFVTAFNNHEAYRSCPEDIAWETEIWIATEPDHMIHRNGHRFMGPYSEKIRRGSLIKHETIGQGTVVKVEADYIEVTFPDILKTMRLPHPLFLDRGVIEVIEV